MKDKNTLIFFSVVGLLLISVSIFTPLSSLISRIIIGAFGISFVLIGYYMYAVSKRREKSAFIIFREVPVKQPQRKVRPIKAIE